MIRFCVQVLVFVFFLHSSQGYKPCPNDELPCENGSCIKSDTWCDGEEDCQDGTDEKYCDVQRDDGKKSVECPAHYFSCEMGWCIPMVGRCNGIANCEDGSDEHNCNGTAENKFSISLLPNYEVETKLLANYTSKNYQSYTSIKNYQSDPGYREDFRESIESAREWLFSQRREDYGWGAETARALVALKLSEDVPSFKDVEEKLMIKQLRLEIAIALSRSSTQTDSLTDYLTLTDLALYINAMIATCQNPRDFHGYDLLGMLRTKERKQRQDPRLNIPPLVYLTFCISNASEVQDLYYMQQFIRQVKKPDMLVLAALTAICFKETSFQISGIEQFEKNILTQLQPYLTSEQPGNIYELALLYQFKHQPNSRYAEPNDVYEKDMMDAILAKQNKSGSFGDILATYYVLPILSGRSLLSLKYICNSPHSDLVPLDVLKNTDRVKFSVTFSLKYGKSGKKKQSVQLEVPEGTSFFDLMRMAQEMNPSYSFKLDTERSIPIVYSIGGVPNDAEKGIYWIPHVSRQVQYKAHEPARKHEEPYDGDIRKYLLKPNEEVSFWLQSL